MAKIDLVEEVLKHSDAEIIEYLYGLISNVRRDYNGVIENPLYLLEHSGEIEQIFSVLKALDRRNKEKAV